MRGSRWFIFFVLTFLLLMFAIEYHLPKKFVWVPTFSHYDEQPFGCAVFDSLLTVSLLRDIHCPERLFIRWNRKILFTTKEYC